MKTIEARIEAVERSVGDAGRQRSALFFADDPTIGGPLVVVLANDAGEKHSLMPGKKVPEGTTIIQRYGPGLGWCQLHGGAAAGGLNDA